jgi:hypothetical protein
MNKNLLLGSVLLLIASSEAFAQSNALNLKTGSTNQIGLTISGYRYDEPSIQVRTTATNVGAEYIGTYAMDGNWFALGQFDYANGPTRYSGSGTASGIPQYYLNLKAAIGHDLAFDGFVVSPYIGIGYRFLNQSFGGVTTSTGAKGYDRKSTYFYLPIGVIHRFAANNNQARIETTLEYDHLLSGNQYSALSQASPYISNQNNTQNAGYGINLAILYKQGDWGVGPYFKYWNIANSQTNTSNVVVDGTRYTYTVKEPANISNELGIKLTYSF